MRIIKVPRINALGLKGPEKAPDLISVEGDVVEVDNSNVEESHKKIYSVAVEDLSKGGVVFVGGDHSISAPILEGFREVYGDDSFLIMFDAHADCMEPMEEPTHEELFRSAIECGFKLENVVLIGVRKIEPEEQKFLDENNVKIFPGVEDVEDYLKNQAAGKKVYVSVDMDVFDPLEIEGVNVPEAGGIREEDFFNLLDEILKLDVRGADVVEVVPEKDVGGKTVELAREILGKFKKYSVVENS